MEVALLQRCTRRLLFIAQVISGIGIAIGSSVGALLAADIAGIGVSGLAISTNVVGAALFAVPATAIVHRYGRRLSLAAGYSTADRAHSSSAPHCQTPYRSCFWDLLLRRGHCRRAAGPLCRGGLGTRCGSGPPSLTRGVGDNNRRDHRAEPRSSRRADGRGVRSAHAGGPFVFSAVLLGVAALPPSGCFGRTQPSSPGSSLELPMQRARLAARGSERRFDGGLAPGRPARRIRDGDRTRSDGRGDDDDAGAYPGRATPPSIL